MAELRDHRPGQAVAEAGTGGAVRGRGGAGGAWVPPFPGEQGCGDQPVLLMALRLLCTFSVHGTREWLFLFL